MVSMRTLASNPLFWIHSELQRLQSEDIERRLVVTQRLDAVRVVDQGRELANDYLGLGPIRGLQRPRQKLLGSRDGVPGQVH